MFTAKLLAGKIPGVTCTPDGRYGLDPATRTSTGAKKEKGILLHFRVLEPLTVLVNPLAIVAVGRFIDAMTLPVDLDAKLDALHVNYFNKLLTKAIKPHLQMATLDVNIDTILIRFLQEGAFRRIRPRDSLSNTQELRGVSFGVLQIQGVQFTHARVATITSRSHGIYHHRQELVSERSGILKVSAIQYQLRVIATSALPATGIPPHRLETRISPAGHDFAVVVAEMVVCGVVVEFAGVRESEVPGGGLATPPNVHLHGRVGVEQVSNQFLTEGPEAMVASYTSWLGVLPIFDQARSKYMEKNYFGSAGFLKGLLLVVNKQQWGPYVGFSSQQPENDEATPSSELIWHKDFALLSHIRSRFSDIKERLKDEDTNFSSPRSVAMVTRLLPGWYNSSGGVVLDILQHYLNKKTSLESLGFLGSSSFIFSLNVSLAQLTCTSLISSLGVTADNTLKTVGVLVAIHCDHWTVALPTSAQNHTQTHKINLVLSVKDVIYKAHPTAALLYHSINTWFRLSHQYYAASKQHGNEAYAPQYTGNLDLPTHDKELSNELRTQDMWGRGVRGRTFEPHGAGLRSSQSEVCFYGFFCVFCSAFFYFVEI